jgi:predicted membrane metal-binding protein
MAEQGKGRARQRQGKARQGKTIRTRLKTRLTISTPHTHSTHMRMHSSNYVLWTTPVTIINYCLLLLLLLLLLWSPIWLLCLLASFNNIAVTRFYARLMDAHLMSALMPDLPGLREEMRQFGLVDVEQDHSAALLLPLRSTCYCC